MIRLIVAIDEHGGIARHGQIPWDWAADRQHFRRMTMGATVLMGRSTFESIGRPLAGRHNIIASRQVDYVVPGCKVTHEPAALSQSVFDIWVAGGASMYELFWDLAEELHVTRIAGSYDCDRFLPDIDTFGGRTFLYRTRAAGCLGGGPANSNAANGVILVKSKE